MMSGEDRIREHRVLSGIPAAPGFAAGEAFVWHKEALQIPRFKVEHSTGEAERLEKARDTARLEIEALQDKVGREVGLEEAAVFEAHAMFLQDSYLLEMADEAIQGGLNAEAAWMEAIEFFAGELEKIPDATLSERALDVRDVGRSVLRCLMGKQRLDMPQFQKPVVLVARDLEPSETAALEKRLILAFCTAEGGPTAHTAILAKAMGLPAVVGLGAGVLDLVQDTSLLVDGNEGLVIVNPSEQEQAAFQMRRSQADDISRQERAHALEPAKTADGQVVEVVANVGSVEDAFKALEMGAEGIGLLRTEFLYLERESAPSEEEQLAAYRAILDVMGDRPVVVRTLDAGGDKQLPYLDLGKEDNPFLGWRAVRMCLDQPEFFKIQLRALLRASPGHNLRIMFPMIATLEEVRKAKTLLTEACRELQDQRIPVAASIQVGIMVEIPSVAVMADQFAAAVDFFSIGTNDLTQYTFAAERTNEKVAHLGDAIHPAILRQIQAVIRAGHAAGIWVGVCGELAGDPDAAPVLLGMGLDEFSLSAGGIPHLKTTLRQWSREAARRLAEQALNLDSAQAVRQLVRQAKEQREAEEQRQARENYQANEEFVRQMDE
jgi:phosphoenolpyruvate-protein phosphotransferase